MKALLSRSSVTLLFASAALAAACGKEPAPAAAAPAARAPPPARVTIATPPAVHLLALEQQRLPDRPEYDDMRLVHITLAPTAAPLPATTELRLHVVFFDADEYTGACAPTEALTLQGEQAPPAGWNRRDPFTLTASCVVPRGLRDRQLLAGRKMRFAGYRVRVYAGCELQAEDARPPALLGAAWPENPGQRSERTP